MVEIAVALITAIASITAAIIQYNATIRAVSAKQEQPEGSAAGARPVESPRVAPPIRRAADASAKPSFLALPNHMYWYFFGSLVAVVIVVFGAVNPDLSAIVNTLLIIPISSLLLVLLFPIPPAYSPLFVTVATGAGYVGYAMSGQFSKAFVPSDFPSILLIYVANVVVVVGVDYWRFARTKRAERSQ